MKADGLSFFLEGSNDKGVLLIHGLTGAPAEMKLVARHLNRKGYNVYAPLLAGHGVDADTLRRSRWEKIGWKASLQASEFLAARTQQISAAGICVGGKLSLLAAERRPETIRAVAIYSPCFHYDGWDVPAIIRCCRRISAGFPAFLSSIASVFAETASLGIKDERMRRLIESMAGKGILEKFPARGSSRCIGWARPSGAGCRRSGTPTLILHAEDDDLSSPETCPLHFRPYRRSA